MPDSPIYNIFRAWRIVGDPNVAALRKAVALILTRHQTLRTCVRLVNGKPVQMIPDIALDVLEYRDIRDQPEAADADAIEAWMAAESRKSIDLENGPVFRAKLLRVGDREHLFFFVTHHVFNDGWSISVLTRDLSEYYNALDSGREPDLPALPISYAEFARAQMSASPLRPNLDYWRAALAGAPPLLDLPTDLIRPMTQRYRGHRLPFEVDAEITRALRTLGRDHGATLFMVLLSVFNVLLFRFSGQTDICVGIPFANRNTSNLENLVGLFVNTLVIRGRLDGEPTFSELLTQVRSRLLEAFRYASTPFEQIIEQLRLPRDPGFNPLFQVMFVFQNTPRCALELDSMTIRDLSNTGSANLTRGTGVSKFDFTLTISEQDEALRCTLEYNTDLFIEDTARNLCKRFLRLLDAVCEHPGHSVARLPMLNSAERHRMVFDWNLTDEPLDKNVTVQGQFAEQVRRVPDTVALLDSSGPVSFLELDRWSHRIAARLKACDIRPGDVVAIIAEPSADWIAAALGVLCVGGIVLPLESAFPRPRLRTFVKESGACVVVTPAGAAALAEGLGTKTLEMPERAAAGDVLDRYEPGTAKMPETAYIVFTSGSTAAPRAVAGTHLGVVNRCRWMARKFPYKEDECCCHHLSPAFVDVVAEVFGPLLAGVPAVVLDRQARADPAALISQLGHLGITRMTLTPTLLRSMLDTRAGIQGLTRLTLWVSSGELLAPDLCRRFFGQLPDATLLNVYGSTEVAADATCFVCPRAMVDGRVPVGRPIDNVKTYVLDALLQPVPAGFKGELHVGGAGVACGYWHQDAATAEKFLPNPFDASLGRMYRTGDLARYREGGNLEVLGRVDGQIKLHGIRVSSEEIEARLNNHEDVRTAVVGLWKDPRGELFLAAWCVPEPGRVVDARELRQHLGHELPRPWVPSYYVPVDALPRLASGKIDHGALPDPRTRDLTPASELSGPIDEVEQKLRSIWIELLQYENIDRHDDFFDLGGHSILVFQLLDRIESIFHTRLQVGTIFLGPTIAELAGHIRQVSETDQPDVIIKIQDRGGTPLVCIPAAATSVLSLRSLCSRFDGDQSFFAVESYGLITGTEPQSNVEEMARTYVDAVRQDQPRGPYCIAGRCFGGVVAFEMAHQITQAGETVALLVLIETAVPLRNFERVLAALRPEEQQRLESLYTSDRACASWAQTGIEAEFKRGLSAAPASIQGMMRAVYDAHLKAVRDYVPTPIDVPITAFRSREGRWNERVGWDLFAHAGYSCTEFEGDRDSMFEPPHVHSLSEALNRVLKRCLRSTKITGTRRG